MKTTEATCWVPEWPTETGWYWFYGRRWKSSEKDELCMVHVRKIVNGVMYIADGHFLYKAEGATGVFQAAVVPPIPAK